MASATLPVKRIKSLPPDRSSSSTKQGYLYKRQRGKNKQDLRNLSFQRRYFVLSAAFLTYYKSNKDMQACGRFQVKNIKIVEEVPLPTFQKKHCFQIGNEEEVMYFHSETEADKLEWMRVFRISAFDVKRNSQLPKYHTGAFGRQEKNQWSCCKEKTRGAEGCEDAILALDRRTMSFDSYIRFEKSDSVTEPLHESIIDFDSGSDEEREYVAKQRPLSTLSLQSTDSGIAASPSNSRKIQRQDSKTSVDRIDELTHLESEELQSSPGIVPNQDFSCTHIIEPPDEVVESNTVLFRGANILSATGEKVYNIELNSGDKIRQLMLSDITGPISLSGWKNHLAVGSSSLVQLINLKNPGERQELNKEDSCTQQLAVFTPTGSLFTASGSQILQWPSPATCRELEQPSANFQIYEHSLATIFSLVISPQPEQPWLAIAFTDKNTLSDFVSVYNYQTKEFVWSMEIENNSKICMAFTHDGQDLYFGNKMGLQYLNLKTKICHSYFSKNTASKTEESSTITSLCCSPVRCHFAMGLSNGVVMVFTSEPERSIKNPCTLSTHEMTGRVTSLSYSNDGMRIAAGFENGAVQIWKAFTAPKERPLLKKDPLTITCQASSHDFPEDGYSISIPQGAVREGTSVTLHHGIVPLSPYGPYQFSDGARPVSVIVSLEPEPRDKEFLKPIELTLAHCLACDTPEDLQKLAFYKTSYDSYTVQGGSKVYQFEKIEDREIVHSSNYTPSNQAKVPQGASTLKTTHCCDLCIGAKYCSEDVVNCSYSLFQIVPRNPDLSQEFRVYYCLLYSLETCRQTLEKQFSPSEYKIEGMVVRFQASGCMTLKIDDIQLEGDWKLRLIPGKTKIEEQQLNFWADDIRYRIGDLCHTGQYPPRIPVCVTPGQQLADGVHTTVSVSGVRGGVPGTNPQVLFCLSLLDATVQHYHTQPEPFQALSPSWQPSSFSLYGAKDDFKDNFDNIARCVKDPKKLASAFFSSSSKKKCPYLDESDVSLTDHHFFKATDQTDTFAANFGILLVAYSLACKYPDYMIAVKNALSIVLSELDKERLGGGWLFSGLNRTPSRPSSTSASTVGDTSSLPTAQACSNLQYNSE